MDRQTLLFLLIVLVIFSTFFKIKIFLSFFSDVVMDGLAHCATSVFAIPGVSMDPAKNPGSATATRVGVDSSVIRYKFEFNRWKKHENAQC
jgi:hypothetical protein